MPLHLSFASKDARVPACCPPPPPRPPFTCFTTYKLTYVDLLTFLLLLLQLRPESREVTCHPHGCTRASCRSRWQAAGTHMSLARPPWGRALAAAPTPVVRRTCTKFQKIRKTQTFLRWCMSMYVASVLARIAYSVVDPGDVHVVAVAIVFTGAVSQS